MVRDARMVKPGVTGDSSPVHCPPSAAAVMSGAAAPCASRPSGFGRLARPFAAVFLALALAASVCVSLAPARAWAATESVYIDLPSDGDNMLRDFLSSQRQELADLLQQLIDGQDETLTVETEISNKLQRLVEEQQTTNEYLEVLAASGSTSGTVVQGESYSDVLTELCGINSTQAGLQIVSIAVSCLLLGVLLGKVLVDHWTVHPK